MGVEIGNALGAVTNLTTALSKEKSVKSFLARINDFGLQVKNNFEVNFSGLSEITFFILSISMPGVHLNFTEVHYDGRKIDIPINHEYDHEFSLTMLNDAQGYIYSAITNFIATDVSNIMANSGYTMTIKALTGDKKYAGALITLRGVRLESVTGLEFGYDLNDIQTFTVNCKCIDFSYTPGAMSTLASLGGALDSLVS